MVVGLAWPVVTIVVLFSLAAGLSSSKFWDRLESLKATLGKSELSFQAQLTTSQALVETGRAAKQSGASESTVDLIVGLARGIRLPGAPTSIEPGQYCYQERDDRRGRDKIYLLLCTDTPGKCEAIRGPNPKTEQTARKFVNVGKIPKMTSGGILGANSLVSGSPSAPCHEVIEG